jgi:hypothetical protein
MLKLDFIVVPTYSTLTLGVADASVYPDDPPTETAPTLEVSVPGYGVVSLTYNMNDLTILSSSNLGISEVGVYQPLPDGMYHIKYSVAPAYENFVEKSILRVDLLQEKFDRAFLQLDMMECDVAIKKQSKIALDSIYYMIQGAIAAANNCAEIQANKLYNQAFRMLDKFIKNNCGCSDVATQITYY